jgi:tyrosinase
MVDIANTYDTAHRQKYLDAAKAFRLPYFDYFRPRGGKVHFPGVVADKMMTEFDFDFTLPAVFNEKDINILAAPADTPTPIGNPLYAFSFKGKSDHFQEKDMRIFVSSLIHVPILVLT